MREDVLTKSLSQTISVPALSARRYAENPGDVVGKDLCSGDADAAAKFSA